MKKVTILQNCFRPHKLRRSYPTSKYSETILGTTKLS